MKNIPLAVLLLSFGCAAMPLFAADFDVKAFGAAGDGQALDTPAITRAIAAAQAAGGGTVHFPAGNYRTTRLMLPSNVTLDLDSAAVIQASPDPADWHSCNLKPVISATNSDHVGIRGSGIIDGGGLTYYDSKGNFIPGDRPQCIVGFSNCQNVSVTGVIFRNSVRWTLVFTQCDQLVVEDIKVRNREYALSRETDGIDLNGGRNILLRHLDIETGDDAICIKPQGDAHHTPVRPTHDIEVRDCIVASTCNAVKFGTGTTDECYNIRFENITINRHAQVVRPKNPATNGNCIAAISVQSNDGGDVHDIVFDHFTVNDCDTPIFLEVQNRQTFAPHDKMGRIYNITFSAITCLKSARASQINVQRGGRLQNIVLRDIEIHNQEDYRGTDSPPYLSGDYPDAYRNGRMPAYGLFARCVDGLTLTSTVVFHDDGGSGRPATKYEDVTDLPPPPAHL